MASLRSLWLWGVVAWIVVLIGGWHQLLLHQFTPGARERDADRWPADTKLTRDLVRPTLVVFAHRNCPCTRATLSELEEILTQCSDRVSVVVVLASPQDGTEDRVGMGIEERVRALPDVQVFLDTEGMEARRFGARTSGHVFLYGAKGHLLFGGGITDARGHEGFSRGRQAVVERLRDGKQESLLLPVYGCPLFSEDAEE
jgi:hypothetical protein